MADTEPFGIYELSVGGGTLALCPLPLGVIDVVVAWAPDLVLSLCEAHEMQPDLWHGFNVIFFPVVDYGVPSGDDWKPIAAHALEVLREGGCVLVHCKGGCGRSGMAVLRLMHAAGEKNALARLRAVRPCAIETGAQLAWAQGAMG